MSTKKYITLFTYNLYCITWKETVFRNGFSPEVRKEAARVFYYLQHRMSYL